MIVDIELTRRSQDRYVARALQFPAVEVEAGSREAALAQVREALTARLAGSEIVQITIANGSGARQPAWPRHAGALPDDEAYRTVLADVERQRPELDEDCAA